MPPKRPPMAKPATALRGSTPKAASWLPADNLTPRQIGLCILVIALVLAGAIDVFREATFDINEQTNSYLNELQKVKTATPATFSSARQIRDVTVTIRDCAALLEDLDTMQYPKVADESKLVLTNVITALRDYDIGSGDDVEATGKMVKAMADLALQTDADNEHVSALLLGTRFNDWAAANIEEDMKSTVEMQSAAYVEQAIAVNNEDAHLRVMYAAMLLKIDKFEHAVRQMERLLRNHPEYEFKRWAEWVLAVAQFHHDGSDSVAADAKRRKLQAKLDPLAVPTTSWIGGVVVPLVPHTTIQRFFVYEV